MTNYYVKEAKANRMNISKASQLNNNDSSNMETKKNQDINRTLPISPSEYIKQFYSNPENILCKNINNERSQSSDFTAEPKIIIFKEFEIDKNYNITLKIRNTSQVPHNVRLLSSQNVSFNVTFKGSTFNTRLAPGMTHSYEVEFHPHQICDYFHDVVFKTDNEFFTVHVIAVGPRALLSFPDQINVGQSAVKVSKTKPILVHNIGEVCTRFSIFTDNPYFIITPSKACIEPGKAIQTNVEFTPMKIQKVKGHFFLRYESGDTVQSVIYGEGVKCDIKIKQNPISIENTYLSLSRLIYIEIENNSDYVLQYEWVKYQATDKNLPEMDKCNVTRMKSDTSINNTQICDESNCQCVYCDENKLLKNEMFVYKNEHYRIFPTNGEVWPRNKTRISVTFQPRTVGTISSTAYLEISGQEYRIPVTLLGKCVGPSLELNILSLDVNEVYLCSTYTYEIVCKNVGPILGTLMFLQKNVNSENIIKIEPDEIEVNLNEIKTMKLSFYSNKIGNFIQRINFLINESSEYVSFILKGTVINPLAIADVEEIRFHRAALCFNSTKKLNFRNHSHDPINFSVKVLSDGYEMPITHETYARAQVKPKFPCCPREFFVYPSEGIIHPQTCIQMQVDYIPNTIRSGKTQIQINTCRTSNIESIILPISFKAKRAILDVNPGTINIETCFVNFLYNRDIKISNSTEVDGYFSFIPQEIHSNTTILYSLSSYQGYLKSGQTKEITLTIIVNQIGLQHESLKLLSIGLESPITCCRITCVGKEPTECTKTQTHVNHSEMQLCQRESTLKLTNKESPVVTESSTSRIKPKYK